MRRTSTMTLGFVLILIGIQLNLVQGYELTPRFSNFLSENGGSVLNQPNSKFAPNNQAFNSPYYQASFPSSTYTQTATQFGPVNLRTINTPGWLCWPVLFFGAVVFLHGFAKQT